MLLRLNEVTKSYGGHRVLSGVSFQINEGDKVALVGRNGAGKTSLFRIICGTEAPDSGEVVAARNLRIGLLEQHIPIDPSETVHTSALSAFQYVHDLELEMRRLEELMESEHSAEVLDRYAEVQTRFEQCDGFAYAARAESVLIGLGLSRETWNITAGQLSGGQKNRLAMARLLLTGADLLLLDEPTNHLDVAAVEWLERFLSEFNGTYVVISHDRYFLDRTANSIIEIDAGKAARYSGNYSDFIVERQLRRELKRREFEGQQALIAKTEEFIRRNIEGQKTKQAKSRRNMLARMQRVEAVADETHGGRFNLKQVVRSGNNVLTVEDLAIGYPGKILARGISFTLHRGNALGIIGGNGTGKTTFLRTILGEIKPLSGEVHWGTKVDIGYYCQQLEDLLPTNDVISELRRMAPLAESGELRSFLAGFLFVGDDVFKRVSDLSGGEKGRLSLAKLIYSRKNVLVLDEPTNHLDIPARESLESALSEYDGTLIIVSHDRYFLNSVADHILAFGDKENAGERIEFYAGNYSEFQQQQANMLGRASARADVVDPALRQRKTQQESPVNRSTKSLSKNRREMLERRTLEIENRISQSEDELARIAAELSEPAIASDRAAFDELTAAYAQLESEIGRLYADWEEISAVLDGQP
ncbi:MAG: ABC transporter ATP-binding protein [Blastocatellia bacterium]